MNRLWALFAFWSVASLVSWAEDYLPLSEIKAGMRGVTLTVLQGTNIVSLETEILGVAENSIGPGKHLIVGRLVDEKTKVTGAVHGMSGSPLYLKGKLAGALSQRIAMFEKDGHCGFTPIQDILEVHSSSSRSSAVQSWQPIKTFPGGSFRDIPKIKSQWLSLPLSFGKSSIYVKKTLEEIWGKLGFTIAEVGSQGDELKAGGELQPGSPVSVAFMTGDLRMAGTGTVTWRKGNQILAFGHPMMNLGEVALPMCEAEIVSTVPSYLMPYKLANVRRTVGTVTQDRLSSIAGTVGQIPVMPRYRVKVQFDEDAPRVYEGHFVSQEKITPGVLASLLMEAVLNTNERGGECNIAMQGRLNLKGKSPLHFDAFSKGQEDAVVTLAYEIYRKVNDLYQQRLEKPEVDQFDLTLQITSKASEFAVEALRLEPQRPEAGQQVKVTVDLKPEYGTKVQKTFQFRLPDEVSSGEEIIVEVASGYLFSYYDELERNRGKVLSTWESSNSESADRLEDLIEQWNQQRSANELMLRISNKKWGVQWRSERLENLPLSVSETLLGTKSGALPLLKHRLLEMSERINAVVEGKAELSFTVE